MTAPESGTAPGGAPDAGDDLDVVDAPGGGDAADAGEAGEGPVGDAPGGGTTGTVGDWTGAVHCGDARATLARMPADSVHAVVTSPPYYAQRDYHVDGQIGREETVAEYVGELVAVFREVRRVLRPDGCVWLNLGDKFATGGDPAGPGEDAPTFARKDKMLVPHRVAIALQDDGWVVRGDAVWHKQNPLPNPVSDRLAEHKEYLFHLAPRPDYWFDVDAVREPHAQASLARAERGRDRPGVAADDYQGDTPETRVAPGESLHPRGKNPGDVFEASSDHFGGDHTAVMPLDVCRPLVKTAVPPRVCPTCGAPHERDRERVTSGSERAAPGGDKFAGQRNDGDRRGPGTTFANDPDERKTPLVRDDGWVPTCDCPAADGGDGAPPAGVVADPFAGAGTTLLVAKRLGRRSLGVELNPDTAAAAERRVGLAPGDPEAVLDDEDQRGLDAFGDGA